MAPCLRSGPQAVGQIVGAPIERLQKGAVHHIAQRDDMPSIGHCDHIGQYLDGILQDCFQGALQVLRRLPVGRCLWGDDADAQAKVGVLYRW